MLSKIEFFMLTTCLYAEISSKGEEEKDTEKDDNLFDSEESETIEKDFGSNKE